MNAVTMGDTRMKAKCDLAADLENSAEVIEKTDSKFGAHGDLVERYRLEDAEFAVVMAGGWRGDAKDAIDMLRDEGVKVDRD